MSSEELSEQKAADKTYYAALREKITVLETALARSRSMTEAEIEKRVQEGIRKRMIPFFEGVKGILDSVPDHIFNEMRSFARFSFNLPEVDEKPDKPTS